MYEGTHDDAVAAIDEDAPEVDVADTGGCVGMAVGVVSTFVFVLEDGEAIEASELVD